MTKNVSMIWCCCKFPHKLCFEYGVAKQVCAKLHCVIHCQHEIPDAVISELQFFMLSVLLTLNNIRKQALF